MLSRSYAKQLTIELAPVAFSNTVVRACDQEGRPERGGDSG
jgi:hypothetical protein